MGILNVTPDSFSDGGTQADPVAAGLAMVADGADIVDVGGESTRPGSSPVSPGEEQARVLPVIRALAANGVLVSIDTRHASTMDAALTAGATIVNDVSGLTHDPASRGIVARWGCPVVLMHMRGTPATMVSLAVYEDVVREVVREISARVMLALSAGIARDCIAIDPGIGFAKNAAQSAALLRRLPELVAMGFPVLTGVSRKSSIGHFGREQDVTKRLPGSLAAGLFAVSRGASILRVHDVRETVQALRVWQALADRPW